MTTLRVRYTIHLAPAIFLERHLCTLRSSAFHCKTFPIVIHVMPRDPGLLVQARNPPTSSSTSSIHPACSLIIRSSWRAERAIIPCFVFIPIAAISAQPQTKGPSLCIGQGSGWTIESNPTSAIWGESAPGHMRLVRPSQVKGRKGGKE